MRIHSSSPRWKPGTQVKPPIFGVGIGQTEHALDAEPDRELRGIHIPVREAMVVVLRMGWVIRRLETHAVDRDAESLGPE